MTRLPENVQAALTTTGRTTGWNFRPLRSLPFDLVNDDGSTCRLVVIPYRCWFEHRREKPFPLRRVG